MFRKGILLIGLFISVFTHLAGQFGYIEGQVIDETGRPVEFVNIGVKEFPQTGTSSGINGVFFLKIPYKNKVTLQFSYIGFRRVNQKAELLENDTVSIEIVITQSSESLPTVVVKAENRNKPSTFTLKPVDIEQIPLPSGNFESILKTIGLGVNTSGGELSSQYSVRGGNFDENLVYVNGFEIYRPLLPRSGQQEGLSFINPDLVSIVEFSSGGFQAKYGDKMSSVLDVTYKKPEEFHASVMLSLLGYSGHIEGTDKKGFTYLFGIRQKSNQYLLNSLNTKGDYKPSFTDIQGMMTVKMGLNWQLEVLGNYSRNKFVFIPEERVTSIGTIDNVKELEVFFEGQEVDAFNSAMGGIAAIYAADSNRLRMKFMASAFRTRETETFDIIGDYFLYQVENNLGDDDFGERLFSLGYGTNHNFARNYLDATIINGAYKGFYYTNNHFLEWGAKYQYEKINDRLNEWARTDSALYSLPYDVNTVWVQEVLKTTLQLESNRYTAYLQDTWVLSEDTLRDINLTGGVRVHYWDVNRELLVSPRVQLSIKPAWERNFIFKAAIGLYHQAPFYRELRNREGELNMDLKAQKSAHFVLGGDYVFKAWGRDFRLITEIYYKQMWDLVPYDIEDVKIRYYGENVAKGYAAGIDVRINGQFVKDAESYITLSYLKTQEDILNDFYIDEEGVRQEIGYLARPTDQRINVGILFQDYFPKNKNFRMHLNLLFGTGMPFSPPESVRYRNYFRIPPYRRVDIGFSALLHDSKKERQPKGFIRHFQSIWISLEVFNLLDIQNTISHIWIKDNNNTYYAFDNHLTSRRLNLRVSAKF